MKKALAIGLLISGCVGQKPRSGQHYYCEAPVIGNTLFDISREPISDRTGSVVTIYAQTKEDAREAVALGATVVLSLRGIENSKAFIDESGVAQFSNLDKGTYDVEVYYLDWIAKKQISLGADQNLVINAIFESTPCE